jgi:hypothetical protein
MTKDKTVTMSRELAERLDSPHSFVRNSARESLRRILAAPVVERQPVAWLTKCKLSGLVEKTEPNEKASNPEHWTDAFPVYTSQPAPVSVVLDERAAFESWAQDDDRFGTSRNCSSNNYDEADTQQAWETWQARAGLDKVKEMN